MLSGTISENFVYEYMSDIYPYLHYLSHVPSVYLDNHIVNIAFFENIFKKKPYTSLEYHVTNNLITRFSFLENNLNHHLGMKPSIMHDILWHSTSWTIYMHGFRSHKPLDIWSNFSEKLRQPYVFSEGQFVSQRAASFVV